MARRLTKLCLNVTMALRADNGVEPPMPESVQTVSYLWVVMPIVAMAVLFLVSLVWLMIRRKQSTTELSSCSAPFTLEQIRQMKNQGTLSQQEYEKLRIMIIRETLPDCTLATSRENGAGQSQQKGPRT